MLLFVLATQLVVPVIAYRKDFISPGYRRLILKPYTGLGSPPGLIDVQCKSCSFIHERSITCTQSCLNVIREYGYKHGVLYLRLYAALEIWKALHKRQPLNVVESAKRVGESVARSTAALTLYQAMSARGFCYNFNLKTELDPVDAQKWIFFGSLFFAFERPSRREVVNKMLVGYALDALLHDHLPSGHPLFVIAAAAVISWRISTKGAGSLRSLWMAILL